MQEPNRRKVKGQAKRTAHLLFGLPRQQVKESEDERRHMALVLSRSPDEKIQRLVTDLLSHDPDNVRTSLAVIAERHGLNFYDISEQYTKLRKAEGFIRMAHRIPDIMEQVAENARDKWDDCAACDGMGKVDTKKGIVDCGTCSGKGIVLVPGDFDNLKLLFDTFSLTGKSAGVSVNLDLRKTNQPESLHDLAGSLSGIIEGQQQK